MLRDQFYTIDVYNATQTAILDNGGNPTQEIAKKVGKKNNVKIAKVAWLSNKNLAKAYGSIVMYLTSGSDATRLLQGQYVSYILVHLIVWSSLVAASSKFPLYNYNEFVQLWDSDLVQDLFRTSQSAQNLSSFVAGYKTVLV